MEYKTFDISAVEGKDYKGAEGTLNFAAGETEKTIEIEIIDDDTHEANETSRSRLQRAAPARPDDGAPCARLAPPGSVRRSYRRLRAQQPPPRGAASAARRGPPQ